MTTCSSRPRPTWSSRPPSSGPRELRNLGRGVLEHLAPEIADEAEYQRLLAEEQPRSAATRLTMRPAATGPPTSTPGCPTRPPNRLTAYLNAYTAPRRPHDERLPIERLRGEGFVALMENIPDPRLASPRRCRDHCDGGPRPRHPALRGRCRDHLDRRPDHRRPGPPTGLPGRDHPGRPRRRRARSWTSAAPAASSRRRSAKRSTSATAAARPRAAQCPRSSARPTTSSPGPAAAGRPRRRQAPLLVPPPQSTRPRLATPPPPERQDQLHSADSDGHPATWTGRRPGPGCGEAVNGVVTFAFLLEGGSLAEDRELVAAGDLSAPWAGRRRGRPGEQPGCLDSRSPERSVTLGYSAYAVW